MNPKPSHFRLGLFVLGAVATLVALLVTLGGGDLLRPKVKVETYFDESVQGLDIGAKVRYRGVVIGAVTGIGFTYSRYEQERPPAERRQYVLVEMAVYPDQLGDVGGGREFVNKLVADGLRIRMAPVGITGIVYLELDFNRAQPELPISWTPENLYIPSAHSTVTNFVDAVERLMARLEPLDLSGTADRLDRLLTTLNRKVGSLDAERLSREAGASLARLNSVLARLDRLAGDEAWGALPADIAATVRSLRAIAEGPELKRTLSALERSSGRLDRVLDGREGDMVELIANLRAASTDLKALSESLRQSPAGVLLAPPPPPTDVYNR